MRTIFCLIIIAVFFTSPETCFSDLSITADKNTAILFVNNNEKPVYSHNSSQLLLPASTLKILTALTALSYLGSDYRFKTDFYLRNGQDLIIKGYGDPLLISEVISSTALILSGSGYLNNIINNIILDNSYFKSEPVPGAASDSSEPYDAGTGSLCANFNTVNFLTSPEGDLQSAEDQTPLLPFIKKRIRETGLKKGRIVLTEKEKKLYPGYLFRYFLQKNGVSVKGKIKTGIARNKTDRLIYTLHSPYRVSEIVQKLLMFSNNFIANQLFLHIGAKEFGEPGTFKKGVRATLDYTNRLSIKDNRISEYNIVEGSGLSRQNKITAEALDAVLKFFYPWRDLLRSDGHDLYKTGTLTGVSTRAGYLICENKSFRYVIFCNSPHYNADKIINLIQKKIKFKEYCR